MWPPILLAAFVKASTRGHDSAPKGKDQMRRQKSVLTVLAWLAAIGTATAAISTAEAKRLRQAAEVVRAIRGQPDKGISEKLWENAQCVVVIPGVKKAALGIGGEFGRGVMSCRKGNGWSAPMFMQLAKGSWGLQIGAAEIDLVLLVMNRDGAEKLLNNKVSLGVGASIAAGPVGRTANAATDAQLRAEILSYSRSRGAFAGVDISGGVLSPDQDANTDAYGANTDPKAIVFGKVASPPQARALLAELSRRVAATDVRLLPPGREGLAPAAATPGI
jgi:lipid-binding SYLF domain-containing protein